VFKSKHFWGGVVAGYLLLVFVPSLNIRTMLVRKSG
jgi:hypothetical protein